jgi:hypothetical protein
LLPDTVGDAKALSLGRALLVGTAATAGRPAPVGATLLAIAFGLANHFAQAIGGADGVVEAGAATAATAVTATFLAAACWDATALGTAVILRFARADSVPLCVATEGVHGADALGYIGVGTADAVVSCAAVTAALAAVLGAGEAVFILVGFAFLVTTHGPSLLTETLSGTGQPGRADATSAATAIGAAFLGDTVGPDALGLASLDAFARGTIKSGRANAAATATAIGATFFVLALGHTDATTKHVAEGAIRALTALAATTVGTALLAVTGWGAVAVAVDVTLKTGGTVAAVATTAVSATLLAGALGGAVETTVELVFALAIEDGLSGTGFHRFRAADIEDALPDHDVLLLGLGTGVLPAPFGAVLVSLGAIPEAVEERFAIPGDLALTGEADLVRTAEPAQAVAAVGTTLLAITTGDADGNAGEVGIALESVGAFSTTSATAVRATLLAKAGRLALVNASAIAAGLSRVAEAATATATVVATLLALAFWLAAAAAATLLTFGDADAVPLCVAAVGIHLADAFFALAAVAAGEIVGGATVTARAAILWAVGAAFAIPEVALAVPTLGPHGNAHVLLADEGRRAGTAEASAAVVSTLLVLAIGKARRHACPIGALFVSGARAATATTPVGPTLFAVAVGGADGLALVVVAEVVGVAGAAIAAAAIGAALLIGAVRHAVLADLELCLAGSIHGPKHTCGIEVHAALPENALDEVKELVLGGWRPLVEAIKEAFGSEIIDASHGTLDQFATGFPRETDTVLASLIGAAGTAGTAAAIGTAILAVAVRFTDHFTLTAQALIAGGADTTATATAVGAALLAGAIGLAAAPAIVAEFHADAVPLDFTAEGVLFADAGFALASAAAWEWPFFATIGAGAAVHGAVGTAFSLLGFTETVAAKGDGLALSEVRALETIRAEATLVTTAIGAALFAYALGLTDVLAQSIAALVAWFADAALAITAIGPAFLACAFWYADRFAGAVDAFGGITAIATGPTAAIRAALFVCAFRGTGNAGEVELIASAQQGRLEAAIGRACRTALLDAGPDILELGVLWRSLVGPSGAQVEALVTGLEATRGTLNHVLAAQGSHTTACKAILAGGAEAAHATALVGAAFLTLALGQAEGFTKTVVADGIGGADAT